MPQNGPGPMPGSPEHFHAGQSTAHSLHLRNLVSAIIKRSAELFDEAATPGALAAPEPKSGLPSDPKFATIAGRQSSTEARSYRVGGAAVFRGS